MTHATTDRLWLLPTICDRWSSKIVLVLYHNEGSFDPSTLEEGQCGGGKLKVISYTKKDGEDDYPVNKLRNEGIANISTTHYLMVDIDFVSSADLNVLVEKVLADKDDDDLLVIPAFERVDEPCKNLNDCKERMKDENYAPKEFEKLKDCVDGGKCRVFQVSTRRG